MANSILHKANTRGHADHGWLDSWQTFSFAGYYNPERINFGVLRVLNDDKVDGGRGFGTHPHDNMEIISIPLEGDLEHKDNLGNVKIIRQGDIQVMSAGTGVFHSEYNKNTDRTAKFLQIWLFPNQLNVQPRYDQVTLDPAQRHNRLQQVLSPSADGEGTWIYQDAWFHMADMDKGKELTYTLKKPGNGIYIFVIEGSVSVDGQRLDRRDGLGLTELTEANLMSLEENSEVLIMEVPMEITV